MEIKLGDLSNAELSDRLAFGLSRAVGFDLFVGFGLDAQIALTDFVETAFLLEFDGERLDESRFTATFAPTWIQYLGKDAVGNFVELVKQTFG